MDDHLFAHFLGKLKFAETTRLRFYHDGDHEGPSSNSRVGVGDEWCSEDEILGRIEELVSFEFWVLSLSVIELLVFPYFCFPIKIR